MSLQLDMNALCTLIVSLNKNIESVAIINKLGRVVEKVSRSKYTFELPDDMNELFFMQCVLQISMGKDFDEYFGPINYHMLERLNLAMLSFPMDDYILLVTTKNHISSISLARKIVNILNEHKKTPSSHFIGQER